SVYPKTLTDFLWKNRQALVAQIEKDTVQATLAQACFSTFKKNIALRNQYINFPDMHEKLLLTSFFKFFTDMGDAMPQSGTETDLRAAITELFVRHRRQLGQIFTNYCETFFHTAPETCEIMKPVACDEYSAQLQIDLLKMDVAQLKSPVLDIGCGIQGNLVAYLRKAGLDAEGIDRQVTVKPGLHQGDWLDFNFEPKRWGTIIAHQSFSTHFIFNHIHSQDLAQKYAGTFMQIINSLQPGGDFYYAPGVPFFEPHLKELDFIEIHQYPIQLETKLAIKDISYAIRLTKRF
ncbi:class I SAM-dependent methyltransferase, partial [bacterium]|nr:class I SAM-dependent methyltransferase [bacterium]